ncbi:MAG: YbaB/EbfC family nucleoid-associated protein [Clostridia bacterium]|nr:YbaB/EbfC family nucleoid-associated protein [Clostridia bacterium]
MANINKMLKQVQKVQAEMARLQEELRALRVEGRSGGGVVTAVANGAPEIVELKIAPEAIDPEDPEMLEDLVMAAVNEALRKAQENINERMAKLTGGLKVPGLF